MDILNDSKLNLCSCISFYGWLGIILGLQQLIRFTNINILSYTVDI